ncbi:MAG: murein biosynthesis integral membrane protein MurJ [Gammaproteobacteria bacterium]|jgi:putative peptidoglycan lipid II flippase|nr:murein biosynthesis integral membrane protein MurJ [Gammaproteobacteria bacterium]
MTRLLHNIGSTAAGTMVSRVLGFLRDVIIARMFGAGMATDAFFVAFRIPNLFRRLFAEGSFALAFVPVLSEYRKRGDQRAVRELIDSISGVLIAVLLIVTAVGVLLAPLLVRIFAPGFDADDPRQAMATDMLRLTFPYLLFISLTALSGGILNTWGKFWIPAVTPALLNISLICAALLLAPVLAVPVMALAWGVLLAGALQLAFQLPALARLGLLPRPGWLPGHAGVRKIMRLMLPTLFGSSVAQVNLLLDTLIASLLMAGSVSWLYYADRMFEFPVGVFGVALSTVILPRLATAVGGQRMIASSHADDQQFTATLQWAMRLAWLISVPAAVGLLLLATPVLQTLFEYGRFSGADTRMTGMALQAYALGLPAVIAVKVLAPGFYARQDTATPVRYAIISMVSNMLLNVLFIFLLLSYVHAPAEATQGLLARLAATPGLHLGLALASAVAAYINMFLLWRRLRRLGWWQAPAGWLLDLSRIGLMSLLMALCLWLLSDLQVLVGALQDRWWLRVAALLVLVLSGMVVYAAAGFFFGLRLSWLQMPTLPRVTPAQEQ